MVRTKLLPLIFKKIPKSARRGHCTKTEHQVARALVQIFHIGARGELATRAKAKTRVYNALLRKFLTGEMMSLCKRMQRRCLQTMTLFTSHKNDPPICGVRDCKDSDKILCNICPLKHEVQERGRGEMIYENTFNPNTVVRKPASTKYN